MLFYGVIIKVRLYFICCNKKHRNKDKSSLWYTRQNKCIETGVNILFQNSFLFYRLKVDNNLNIACHFFVVGTANGLCSCPPPNSVKKIESSNRNLLKRRYWNHWICFYVKLFLLRWMLGFIFFTCLICCWSSKSIVSGMHNQVLPSYGFAQP